MDDKTLSIVIQAKDEATKVLNQVSDSVDNVSNSVEKGLGRKIADVFGTGGAFYGMTKIVTESIAAFSQSETATAQLNAVLESTKGKAGITAEAVLSLSSALQQQSKFEDEAITGAQNMLLTFTSIGKDVFPQATKTVLDMSQSLGQDLKSSAIQLGKALNDPIQGVTALRRVGVSFNEDQLKQIETMQRAGNIMGAQKLILSELATEFGGSALKASQTFDGQMTILNNNVGDLKETIGSGLVEALFKLTGGFSNANSAIVALNNFLVQHKDFLYAVIAAISVLTITFGVLFVTALLAVAGTAGLVVLAIGAIVTAIAFAGTMIIYHFDTIKQKFLEVVNLLTTQWYNFSNAFQATALVMALNFFLTVDSMTTRVSEFVSAANGFISNLANHFFQKASDIVTAWTNAMNLIKQKVNDAINYIRDVVNSFVPKIKIGIELPDIEGAFNSLKSRAHTLGIPGFANGGYVQNTGLAYVHAGEYVLSRDMLAGRQQVEAPVSNYNSPITINATINNEFDINELGYKLRWYLNNSR